MVNNYKISFICESPHPSEGFSITVMKDKIYKNISSMEIEVVIDYDIEGNLVGIEIINLQYFLKIDINKALSDWMQLGNITYDSDDDVFYLRLIANRQSAEQKCVLANCLIDEEGYLVGIKWQNNK